MQTVFNAASRSLSGRMLGHALAVMRPMAQDLGDASFTERLDAIRRNYRYVADYFMSGSDDPQRSEVIRSLVREAYELLDDMYLRQRQKESLSYEFREMLRPVEGSANAEDAFRYFWLGPVDQPHLDRFMALVSDPEMEDEALMAVSALTLSLLRSFSELGILTLLRAAEPQFSQCVRERAWVSAILVLLNYDERLRFFPDIVSALQDLLDEEDGRVYACTATTCIVRTLGTDWANGAYESLQQKLLPLLNKHMPESFAKDTISADELDDFSGKLGDEFSDILEEQRREMAKLQEERLDTQFAMFRDMYSTSFFSQPYRWWLPYSDYYLLEEVKQCKQIFGLIPMQDVCDSDRYAFLTTMARIGIVNGQKISDLPVPEQPEGQEQGEYLLCNDYVRQAYRFFRLNPWQIADPFAALSALPSSQIFRLLYSSASEKNILAGHIMRCHSYEMASSIYIQIADTLALPEVYGNLAFCCQKLRRFEEAVANYRKAGSSEWHLRQMEYCYSQLGRYDDALSVCDSLLQLKPESEAYIYEKAKCCERLELYAEALQLFYRLDLLRPDAPSVCRSIAWCSFMCDDKEAALAYYAKLAAAGKEKPIDWLNQGHLHFVYGDRMEAFRYYHRCLLQLASLKDFLQMFRPDRRFLMEKGISKEEIYLMEDQLISAHFGA